MYPIAIIGEHCTAHSDIESAVVANLCRRSGFEDIRLFSTPNREISHITPGAYTLGANLTRILIATGCNKELLETGYRPGREQVRLAASGYLLSELPLGQFAEDRYCAPHLNISHENLTRMVSSTQESEPQPALSELEKTFPLIINTAAEIDVGEDRTNYTHNLWQAMVPGPPATANITWLADHATAWQCSTADATYYWFAVPDGFAPDELSWPGALAEAASNTHLLMPIHNHVHVREHWAEGSVTHLGRACYPASPYRREAWLLGLEDAWVISRMLENYEEAMHEGVQQYTRFRRPRAVKVQRTTSEVMQTYLTADKLTQTKRNLGIAFRTRFLPEMAMQRIDWLYQYDCIKGFH